MVISNLVHRDFEPLVADFGDVVNTRKPAAFAAKRKGVNDDVTVQNATATNIAVPLDQHVHVSFMIRDSEASKSFKDLVALYLQPALEAQAQYLDIALLGQMYRFNRYYSYIGCTPTKDIILDVRKGFNDNNVPMSGRNLILTSGAETALLKGSDFDATGGGPGIADLAMREAYLGRVGGFETYMCQNAPVIGTSDMESATTITEILAVGGVSLTAADRTALTVGTIFYTGDELVPHVVVTSGAGAGVVTFLPAATILSADNDDLYIVGGGAINQASTAVADSGLAGTAGYAVGWTKALIINGTTIAPQVGQLVNFGTNADPDKFYSVVEATTTSLTLDRPLHTALANAAVIHLGPAASYNFAFRQNALALVVRPLILPPSGNVRASVVNYNGLSVRVTMSYDAKGQGTLVTVDMLCGFAVMESYAGGILLS
jgi:hypothetical protein